MTDRIAFEAHFKLTQRQAMRDNAGEYRDEFVRAKWEGWQAAMAAKNALPKVSQHRGCNSCAHQDAAPDGACETCFDDPKSSNPRMLNWQEKPPRDA